MKLEIDKGSTSKRLGIFVQDNSKTTGEGLTGLAFNSAGLSWYYWREDQGDVGGAQVTLASATRGTFTSGGFVEKDATNLPGFYEIGVPNAAFDYGSNWVSMMLKGASNMAPIPLEIVLADPLGIPSSVSDASPAANDFDAAAGLSATDDFYNGCLIVFTEGTLKGITRVASDYVGATRTFKFNGTGAAPDAPFPVAPANGDNFEILSIGRAS